MDNQDKIFFRNFSITVVILAVIMAIFLVVALAVTSAYLPAHGNTDTSSIEERTAPVGRLVTEQAEPQQQAPETMVAAATDAATDGAAPAAADGKAVYSGLCISCHGSGIPGIPQLGDAAAWAERIGKGSEALYANAINGYTGTSGIPMPAKGGNPALSDAEVQAAVDYMVENSQ